MRSIIIALLCFIGFAASAQNPHIAKYSRYVPFDVATLYFPANTGGVWFDMTTGKMRYHDGTGNHDFGSGSGGETTAWGNIPGTLSSQTDLQNALNLKANIANPTFSTGITTPLIKMTSGGPGLGKLLASDADGDATWVQAIEGFTTISSDYTLISTNVSPYTNSGIIRVTGAGDKDITVPSGLALHSKIIFVNEGAGTVRFIQGSGTLVKNLDVEIAPNEIGSIYQSATENWVASGGGSSGGSGGGISDCTTNIIEKTSSYTLTLADLSDCNNSVVAILTPTTDIDFTFPLHSAVAWEDKTYVSLYNASVDDTVTVILPSGITPTGQTNLEIPPKGALTLVSPSADVVHAVGNQSGGSGGVDLSGINTNELITDNGTTLAGSGFSVPSAGVIQASGAGSNLPANLRAKGTSTAGLESGTNYIYVDNNSTIFNKNLILGGLTTSMNGLTYGVFFRGGNSVPSGAPSAGAYAYSRAISGGDIELFAMNDSGVETQITRPNGSATLNFGSIAAGASATLTITVTGAADGDITVHSVPNAAMTAGLVFTSWVSATNTVSIQCHNSTGGAIDPSSATFKASVFK